MKMRNVAGPGRRGRRRWWPLLLSRLWMGSFFVRLRGVVESLLVIRVQPLRGWLGFKYLPVFAAPSSILLRGARESDLHG